jgi:hypothetical protein
MKPFFNKTSLRNAHFKEYFLFVSHVDEGFFLLLEQNKMIERDHNLVWNLDWKEELFCKEECEKVFVTGVINYMVKATARKSNYSNTSFLILRNKKKTSQAVFVVINREKLEGI